MEQLTAAGFQPMANRHNDATFDAPLGVPESYPSAHPVATGHRVCLRAHFCVDRHQNRIVVRRYLDHLDTYGTMRR